MMPSKENSYPDNVDSSYLERSQVLRASWKEPSKASTSFRTSNTLASSTLTRPAKQPVYAAKGP